MDGLPAAALNDPSRRDHGLCEWPQDVFGE